eukprot:69307_1
MSSVFKTILKAKQYNGRNIFIDKGIDKKHSYFGVNQQDLHIILRQNDPNFKLSKTQMGANEFHKYKVGEGQFMDKIDFPLKAFHMNQVDTTDYPSNAGVQDKRLFIQHDNTGSFATVQQIVGKSDVLTKFDNGTLYTVKAFKSARKDGQVQILREPTTVYAHSFISLYMLYLNPNGCRRRYWLDPKDNSKQKDIRQFVWSDKSRRIELHLKRNYVYARSNDRFRKTHIGQCYKNIKTGKFVIVTSCDKFIRNSGETLVEVMDVLHCDDIKNLRERTKRHGTLFDVDGVVTKYEQYGCPHNVCFIRMNQKKTEIRVSELNIGKHIPLGSIGYWKPVQNWTPDKGMYVFGGLYGACFLEERLMKIDWTAQRRGIIKERSGYPPEYFEPDHAIDQIMTWIDGTAMYNKRCVGLDLMLLQFLNLDRCLDSETTIHHPVYCAPKHLLAHEVFEMINELADEGAKGHVIIDINHKKITHHLIVTLATQDQQELHFLSDTDHINADAPFGCCSCNDTAYQLTDYRRNSFWYPRSKCHHKALARDRLTWNSWQNKRTGYKPWNDLKVIHTCMGDPCYINGNDPVHGGRNGLTQWWETTMKQSIVFKNNKAKQKKLFIKMLDVQRLNNIPMQCKLKPENYDNGVLVGVDLEQTEFALKSMHVALQYFEETEQFYQTEFGNALALSFDCHFYLSRGIKDPKICAPSLALLQRKKCCGKMGIKKVRKEKVDEKDNSESKTQQPKKVQQAIEKNWRVKKMSEHTKLIPKGQTRTTYHNTMYEQLMMMDNINNVNVLNCKVKEKTMKKSKDNANSGPKNKPLHQNCMERYNRQNKLMYVMEANAVTETGRLDPIHGIYTFSPVLRAVTAASGSYISMFVDMENNPHKPRFIDGAKLHNIILKQNLPNIFYSSFKLSEVERDLQTVIKSYKKREEQGNITSWSCYKKCDFWREMSKHEIKRGNIVYHKEFNAMLLIEYILKIEYETGMEIILLLGWRVSHDNWLTGEVFRHAKLDCTVFRAYEIGKIEAIVFWDHLCPPTCQFQSDKIIHDLNTDFKVVYHCHTRPGHLGVGKYFPLLKREGDYIRKS